MPLPLSHKAGGSDTWSGTGPEDAAKLAGSYRPDVPAPSALQRMNVAELATFARARGIELAQDATKAQIIEQINASR